MADDTPVRRKYLLSSIRKSLRDQSSPCYLGLFKYINTLLGGSGKAYDSIQTMFKIQGKMRMNGGGAVWEPPKSRINVFKQPPNSWINADFIQIKIPKNTQTRNLNCIIKIMIDSF